jgi:hypothetical protein
VEGSLQINYHEDLTLQAYSVCTTLSKGITLAMPLISFR